MIEDRERTISIALPSPSESRRTDLRVRSIKLEARDIGALDDIPATSPTRTLIDLATVVSERRLERAVNAADKLGLVHPEKLRSEVAERRWLRGTPALRRLLDEQTFRMTDSELERKFLRVVAAAGLEPPATQVRLNGFVVDFFCATSGSSWKPMACATTAPQPPRPVTAAATKRTRPPG